MQLASFIFVGLGGAVGAMLRYAVSLLPYKGTFPVLTLVTNLLGALAIGVIAGMAARRQLLEKGHPGLAVTYMLLSVLGCLAGVAAGLWAASRW